MAAAASNWTPFPLWSPDWRNTTRNCAGNRHAALGVGALVLVTAEELVSCARARLPRMGEDVGYHATLWAVKGNHGFFLPSTLAHIATQRVGGGPE